MYKSKKHRKRINKRFSRHRKINKRNKTRKFRGGNKDENNFTLVGYTDDSTDRPWVPFFLLNNLEYNFDTTDKFPPTLQNRRTYMAYHFILPQLYKLKIRGLNLDRLLDPHTHNLSYGFNLFYDERGNVVIDNNFVPNIASSNVTLRQWLDTSPAKDKPRYRDIIREVELKYPGLFQRMYITPEEEEAALKAIEEKEKEKQEEETLTSTKNEEIQQIKRTLQEIQRKINGKEEDTEEMKETYAREMEEMEGMIPYIREDAKAAKAKKAEKTARKKYYNTYFQNAF